MLAIKTIVHPTDFSEHSGYAFRVACALAQEVKADLIVMGTHGRTGVGRLLLGSVAEAVLRRAPCPVLTLKMPFPSGASPAPQPRAEPAHA
jgi:nucleotide-binding universal stress UspA family protein